MEKTYYSLTAGSTFIGTDGVAHVFTGGKLVTSDAGVIAALDKLVATKVHGISTEAPAVAPALQRTKQLLPITGLVPESEALAPAVEVSLKPVVPLAAFPKRI